MEKNERIYIHIIESELGIMVSNENNMKTEQIISILSSALHDFMVKLQIENEKKKLYELE